MEKNKKRVFTGTVAMLVILFGLLRIAIFTGYHMVTPFLPEIARNLDTTIVVIGLAISIRSAMGWTESSEAARPSEPHKPSPSSDCRLQPACMKLESLVIAGQHTAVNTFPGLVHTARHTTEVIHTRSRQANRKEAAV